MDIKFILLLQLTVCKYYIVKFVISLTSLKLLSPSQIEFIDLNRSSTTKNGELSTGQQWSSTSTELQ